MKKLMKKKVNMFGKSVPVFLIVMVAMAGLASAALVPYLSLALTGTVAVSNPLALSRGTFTIDAADAFNPIEEDFTLENNADTAIAAVVETSITGIDGATPVGFSDGTGDTEFGEEFEYFLIGLEKPKINDAVVLTSCEDLSSFGYAGSDEWSVYNSSEDNDGYCYWNAKTEEHWSGVEGGVYYVQMGDTHDTDQIPAGAIMNGRVKFQFKINVAPATYAFETQALIVDSLITGSAKDLYD